MAPLTQASDENTHHVLLDQLDIYAIRKPFRNPNWKPAQRRNKNVKQIIADASRKENSVMATQNNSGTSTPAFANSTTATGGTGTPIGSSNLNPNIAQAAHSLSTLVLERNLKASGQMSGPAATYTNIEAAPSLHPSAHRNYCDITGLPGLYKDPKTGLRYHNKEIFQVVRGLGPGLAEGYLAARGAHTVLK